MKKLWIIFLLFLSCSIENGRGAGEPPLRFGRPLSSDPKNIDPIVRDHLNKYKIRVDPAWSAFRIHYEGTPFEISQMPPKEFLRTHQHMVNYHIEEVANDEQLKAFIVYRLLDKYNYHDEVFAITKLDQIDRLMDSPDFVNSFIHFLRLQTQAIVLGDLENDIVNVSREGPDNTPSLKQDSPIRKENINFIRMKTKEADDAWKNVLQWRDIILGDRPHH